MGKWAQRRLLELGATPVHELGLGNDDQDLQADFETWREGLWPALSAAIKGGTEGAAEWAESAVAFEASFRCRWLPGTFDAPTFLPSSSFEWLCRAYPKQTLYECRVEATGEPRADEPRADEPRADEPRADEPRADDEPRRRLGAPH